MEKLPESLAIAIWIVGSCWALAILVYLIGAPMEWVLPIFIFGLLTGIAEWFLRRKSE
jgi:predicted metal-binding membrane protein